MKNFGNWKQSKMKSAIISDKPTHEKVNDEQNIKAYGGYLVAESAFNEDIRRLIINAPKLLDNIKDLFEFVNNSIGITGWHENGEVLEWDDIESLLELQEIINQIEGDKD